jgi:hypothetical protein
MNFLVRPASPVASFDSLQARPTGYCAHFAICPDSTYKSGKAVQTNGTTSIRQVKLRGLAKVSDVFSLSRLAVNLRRLPQLLAKSAMAGSG